MILATHALTGAVIGKSINNPWLIIAVSLAIHYAMDSLRHGEYLDDRTGTVKNAWWKITADILFGLIIIFGCIYFAKLDLTNIQNVLLGAFFSMFPDLLTVLHWKFKNIKILAKIKKFHAFAHHYSKFPKYGPERQWSLKNARNDILISILATLVLFFF